MMDFIFLIFLKFARAVQWDWRARNKKEEK